MKMTATTNEVERSNVSGEQNFSIKTTSLAFSILSSGIYTDPKLAVIRELSTNAYDAHVAANRSDVPFEIHLPNFLEPWFHVRDFGTGLDDNDVMHLYTTYFDSTKSNSNAFIGALGLGSKSPFSYTKAFEVVSRFNGKRRMYSAFINENGVPSIARLGEVNTDEHNGLEVRITIDKSDWTDFCVKTSKALRWFPVKPTIIGQHNFAWPQISKERLEGTGWKMFEKNFAGDYSKMTAVQGNVAYKVDISKLDLTRDDFKILESAHVVGFFDIGDLEVAANREEIRYDERSKIALLEKIAHVRAGVLRSIEQQVEAIQDKPFWNVMIELNTIAEQIFGNRGLFKEFIKNTTNKFILRYVETHGSLKFTSLRGHEISGLQQTSGRDGRTTKRVQVGSSISPESHIVIFYNDLPSGGMGRIAEWVRRTNNTPTAIIIRPKKNYGDSQYKTDAAGEKTWVMNTWTEQQYIDELTLFRQELGDVNFLLASKDTPPLTRVRSSYKNELPIFQYDGYAGKYDKQHITWKRTPTVNIEEGGLYFHLQNGTHISFLNKTGDLQNVTWRITDVDSNLRLAVDMINTHFKTDYSIRDVFGVGSQAIKKITKHENWINIFDALREVTKSYDMAIAYFARLQNTPNICGIKTRATSRVSTGFVNSVNALDTESIFRQAVKPIIDDHIKYGKLESVVRFISKINVDLDLGMVEDNVLGYFEARSTDFSEYPMLKFISSIEHQSDYELKVLFDYIKLIDRS